MTITVTKESLAQWIAEMESQPHLSLREERYLAIMHELNSRMPCAHHWAWRMSEEGPEHYCVKCRTVE